MFCGFFFLLSGEGSLMWTSESIALKGFLFWVLSLMSFSLLFSIFLNIIISFTDSGWSRNENRSLRQRVDLEDDHFVV